MGKSSELAHSLQFLKPNFFEVYHRFLYFGVLLIGSLGYIGSYLGNLIFTYEGDRLLI